MNIIKKIMLDSRSFKKFLRIIIFFSFRIINPFKHFTIIFFSLFRFTIKPGQTVLEIGCGSGFFTVHAAKMLGEEGMLYSTDIHDVAIEQTQKKVNKFSLKNVIVKKDDAMKSTFADEMFDLVLLYGVVPAPVISMKDISVEIHRLLKPGGIYAICTMVPFWTPNSALKYVAFEKLDNVNGVFILRRI